MRGVAHAERVMREIYSIDQYDEILPRGAPPAPLRTSSDYRTPGADCDPIAA